MNYIQILFSLMTSAIIVSSSLLNIFEKYLPTFFVQTFRYGKFAYNGNDKSKFVFDVPKSWFKHFYQLSIVVQTYFLILITNIYVFHKQVPQWLDNVINLVCGPDRIAQTPAIKIYITVLLLTLQVYRRFYETQFVSIFGKNSRMNITHYIVGLLHYTCIAIAILCEAPLFSYTLIMDTVQPLKISDLNAIDLLAIILFLLSWYHQHVCTKILANLRKNKKGIVVTDDHRLPEGDWFKYLSCPHQTTEILMYFSLTILLQNHITWFFVFVWVLSNQVETILLSHWWYEESFEKFPKDRKALIPFIY